MWLRSKYNFRRTEVLESTIRSSSSDDRQHCGIAALCIAPIANQRSGIR
jgi:hypothetical protein